MKLIIDISDEQVLFDIKNHGLTAKSETDAVIIDALYNGTPVTDCEDAISRQAVLNVFGDVHPLDHNANAYIEQIKALPSVQPKAKTGKWSVYPVNHNNAFMCDSCFMSVETPSDFCPNCGADMRGAQNED